MDDFAPVLESARGPPVVRHRCDRVVRRPARHGIVVSKYGGRQLDGAASTIERLPALADAAAGRLTLLIDSGFRSGTDIAKAIALGADAVQLGRATLYSLAAGGEAGARHVLAMLAEKRQTGIGRSIAGRIPRSRLYEPGAKLVLPAAAPATVEFEIAYVLARDIAPGAVLASPLDAVAEVRTSFEIVLSRFVDRLAVGWPSDPLPLARGLVSHDQQNAVMPWTLPRRYRDLARDPPHPRCRH